jgi:O-antigen/teichoic acid export membrane protein
MASFWGTGVTSVLANNVAILALPLFASPADIGLYGIAQRMATMSVTILDALGNVFGPAFARHYARKNASGLRHELLMSQLYSFLAFLPFLIIFVFFAKPLLNLIGEDFIAARQFLMILLVGQLFNSATGLAGLLLNMSHRQHLTSYVTFGQALLTASLVFLLGSKYGGLGVAIAVGVSVAAKNLVLYVLARLGIDRDAREWETQPANLPADNLLESRH